MIALLTSCASTDSRSINKSATDAGKLQAVRTIPDLPADCRAKESHVRVTKDADPWSLLILEGQQLDKQNARTDRCGGFYDRMKATQEAATN
jgi:hypothetical protein